MITFKEILIFLGLEKQSRSKEYGNYLESFRWFLVRHARLYIDVWHCVNCGATRSLQVHHLNYDYMGLRYSFLANPVTYLWSMVMELWNCRTLCARCHWDETVKQKDNG
jgi:5-methylcytosine-specific restriction endonuclease McrA